MLKNFIKKIYSFEIVKYYTVSAISFILMFSLLLILVEHFEINEVLSYSITYLIIYIFDFLSTFRYVFNQNFSPAKIIKYFIVIIFFFLINIIFYERLVNYLNLYYIYSAIVCLIFFSVLKFVTKKKLIFNK